MGLPGFSHNFSRSALYYLTFFCFTGYILVVGCLSFTVCYKHGPLVEERSVSLLAWTLRLLSLLLIYAGVTGPQFAYTAMLLLLSARNLRHLLQAFSYVRWCVSFFFFLPS